MTDVISIILKFSPSNTSGAIHAALPLLFVMYVFMSHAVPKSQIFRTVPHRVSSRLQEERVIHACVYTCKYGLNGSYGFGISVK